MTTARHRPRHTITEQMLGLEQSTQASSDNDHTLDGPAMNRYERGARLAAVQPGSGQQQRIIRGVEVDLEFARLNECSRLVGS